ncbi:MAG: transglycosylase domain-containing protein [Leptospiraceae bacterium]|nr:transglycosylase domain-containing protein [Leptospiraceae bacterium]
MNYWMMIRERTPSVLKKIPYKAVLLWGTLVLVGAITVLVSAVAVDFLGDREGLVRALEREKQWLQGVGQEKPHPPILILARNGEVMGEFVPVRGSRISLESCKTDLTWLNRAVVSAEDKEFYDHMGISLRGIARAMINNVIHFSIREGGGSVTQQLARNLFTDHSPTLYRKIYETFAAFQIESMMSKDEILCLYMNRIYMGEGRVGAEEASWFYFRKPPQNLDAAEAAMIAGLFPSPVRYSPLNDIVLSTRKQNLVLDALVEQGHLTEEERQKSLANFQKRYEVSLSEQDPHPGLIGAYGASRDFRKNDAPAANEAAKSFLYEAVPEEIIRQGGLKIYTTIDLEKQRSALRSVRNTVDQMREKVSANATKAGLSPKLARNLNGVLLSMTVPDGNITAMVGGYAVTEGWNQTSRIYTMRRQPGSALKGFLYAVAMDRDVLKPDSQVVDRRLDYDGYSPRNWYGHYKGEMPLRKAVALSVNTVAVSTLHDLGVSYFRDRLTQALELSYYDASQRFDGGLSLALGTGELTPMELLRIYGMILNDGYLIRPRLILRIEDAQGTVQWQAPENEEKVSVLSPESAAAAIWLMQAVVDEVESGTAGWIGKRKAKDKNFLPFPIAGKSGTVQTPPAVRKKYPGMPGSRDAWFVGMVPGEVSVVWVGHDNGAPFPGGGSSTAGAIWADFASHSFRTIRNRFPEVPDLEEQPEIEIEEETPVPFLNPHESHLPDSPEGLEGNGETPGRADHFFTP